MIDQLPYEMESASADFNRLFEESPIPIFIYDSDSLMFLAVNAATEYYYGFSRDEFRRMSLRDIARKDDTGFASEVIKMPLLNTFYDSGRQRHVKKNGSVFYAQVYSHSTQFESKTVRVMLAMDIHNKVLMEQKNEELNKLVLAQKNRMDDIHSAVSDVIWSARADNFEIVYMNDACRSVFGYEPEELKGKSRIFYEVVLPEDKSSVKTAWGTLLRTGKNVFEYRIRHRDGSVRYVINQAILKPKTGKEPAMMNGVVVDVTSLKAMEDTINENARKIGTILESITDGFYAVDFDWNFSYINKEFEKIIGNNRKDLLGKYLWDYFPDTRGLRFYAEQYRAMKMRISVHFEEFLPRFEKWFYVNAYPTDDGMAVYMRDITEEKNRVLKIQDQKDKLKEISWIQSHKVRAPVAGILGLVDLFNLNDPTDPINKEIVDKIKSAANNMDNVIKEIVGKTS